MTEHEDADGRRAADADDAVVESVEIADADLVLRTRSGDRGAFGELWRRHYRSGITVARNVSPGTDADDLVQEAYTKIYQSILRGGGPTGSFRAYLFTSIRNTAAGWGRVRRETTIDELETLEDPATSEQATTEALDRGLTHQAFRSLPTRWQEVLWYSEIEGMKPAEMAPLLGMKPTAVAQLTFRAREGLREAWIQAHLRTLEDGSECAWSVERLGAYSRNNIGRRDRARLETHLATCARCTIVASEAKEVSSRLALVLVPLTIGITGAAGYLASLQGGSAPIVALAAMPSAVTQGAVSAGVAGSAAGTGSAAGSAAAAGAGSAATAGVAAAGGSAGAAAVSATVATAATVATTGAVGAGVAGLAAVSLVVAGTVATAIALPDNDVTEAPESVAASSQTAADEPLPPLETLTETALDLAAAGGPSPSDIPELPAEADAGGAPDTPSDDGGEDDTAAETPGGDDTTAPGTPQNGDDSPAGTPNPPSGPGNSNGDNGNSNGDNGANNGNGNGNGNGHGNNGNGNNGNGNANGNGNGNSGTGANNGTPQSGNANSGSGANNGPNGAVVPIEDAVPVPASVGASHVPNVANGAGAAGGNSNGSGNAAATGGGDGQDPAGNGSGTPASGVGAAGGGDTANGAGAAGANGNGTANGAGATGANGNGTANGTGNGQNPTGTGAPANNGNATSNGTPANNGNAAGSGNSAGSPNGGNGQDPAGSGTGTPAHNGSAANNGSSAGASQGSGSPAPDTTPGSNATADAGAGQGSSGTPAGSGAQGSATPDAAATNLSIVSSSATTAAGQTTISILLSGAPDALVQARIRSTARATATLDASGTAVIVVRPTAAELSSGARLELRYADASPLGDPVSARLTELV